MYVCIYEETESLARNYLPLKILLSNLISLHFLLLGRISTSFLTQISSAEFFFLRYHFFTTISLLFFSCPVHFLLQFFQISHLPLFTFSPLLPTESINSNVSLRFRNMAGFTSQYLVFFIHAVSVYLRQLFISISTYVFRFTHFSFFSFGVCVCVCEWFFRVDKW